MVSKYIITSLVFLLTLVRYPAVTLPFSENIHQSKINPGEPQNGPSQQDNSIQVSDVSFSYDFGEFLKIHAVILSGALITRANLLIQPDGKNVQVVSFTLNSDGNADILLDLKKSPLPPFSRIEYWFSIESDRNKFTSNKFWFNYLDNRYNWHSLENQSIAVYWQQGGLDFGQEIMDSAQQSLSTSQKLFPPRPSSPLKIYVYSNPTDLRSALENNLPYLVSGHASPEIGLVSISIPSGPEQKTDIKRQIPHEITHILQYQALGKFYLRLPVWLLEGSAVNAEQAPNPQYQDLLLKAIKAGSLLSMSSLCSSFPTEPDSALLAYAQSASFVKSIGMYFGDNAMKELTNNYRNGMGCNEGFIAATGVSIDNYEQHWRQETSPNLEPSSTQQPTASSYFLVFSLIISASIIPLLAIGKHALPEGLIKDD